MGVSSVNVRGDIFRAGARDGGSNDAWVDDVRVARVVIVIGVVVVVERDRAREARGVVGVGAVGVGTRGGGGDGKLEPGERRASTRVQTAAAGIRRRIRVAVRRSERGRARGVGVDRSERGGVLRVGDDG